MFKTLMMSLGLAAALGVCSVSKAGGLLDKDDDVKTVGFGIASAQDPKPSAQCVKPSAQCLPSPQCPLTKFHNPLPGLCTKFTGLCAKLKPQAPTCSYEWVLKKKICWNPYPCVLPSAQCSPQSIGSSPQSSTYGGTYPLSAVRRPALTPEATDAPAATGDKAAPAPAGSDPPGHGPCRPRGSGHESARLLLRPRPRRSAPRACSSPAPRATEQSVYGSCRLTID